MNTLADKARAGFDSLTPAERAKINTDTLDMVNSAHCIQGQLHGNYWDSPVFKQESDDSAIELGFFIDNEDMDHETFHRAYVELTDAWVSLLKAERETK